MPPVTAAYRAGPAVMADVHEWRVPLEAALTLGALDCVRQQAPVQRIEAGQHRVGKPEPVELLEEAVGRADGLAVLET
jgi:hypothetical protein